MRRERSRVTRCGAGTKGSVSRCTSTTHPRCLLAEVPTHKFSLSLQTFGFAAPEAVADNDSTMGARPSCPEPTSAEETKDEAGLVPDSPPPSKAPPEATALESVRARSSGSAGIIIALPRRVASAVRQAVAQHGGVLRALAATALATALGCHGVTVDEVPWASLLGFRIIARGVAWTSAGSTARCNRIVVALRPSWARGQLCEVRLEGVVVTTPACGDDAADVARDLLSEARRVFFSGARVVEASSSTRRVRVEARRVRLETTIGAPRRVAVEVDGLTCCDDDLHIAWRRPAVLRSWTSDGAPQATVELRADGAVSAQLRVHHDDVAAPRNAWTADRCWRWYRVLCDLESSSSLPSATLEITTLDDATVRLSSDRVELKDGSAAFERLAGTVSCKNKEDVLMEATLGRACVSFTTQSDDVVVTFPHENGETREIRLLNRRLLWRGRPRNHGPSRVARWLEAVLPSRVRCEPIARLHVRSEETSAVLVDATIDVSTRRPPSPRDAFADRRQGCLTVAVAARRLDGTVCAADLGAQTTNYAVGLTGFELAYESAAAVARKYGIEPDAGNLAIARGSLDLTCGGIDVDVSSSNGAASSNGRLWATAAVDAAVLAIVAALDDGDDDEDQMVPPVDVSFRAAGGRAFGSTFGPAAARRFDDDVWPRVRLEAHVRDASDGSLVARLRGSKRRPRGAFDGGPDVTLDARREKPLVLDGPDLAALVDAAMRRSPALRSCRLMFRADELGVRCGVSGINAQSRRCAVVVSRNDESDTVTTSSELAAGSARLGLVSDDDSTEVFFETHASEDDDDDGPRLQARVSDDGGRVDVLAPAGATVAMAGLRAAMRRLAAVANDDDTTSGFLKTLTTLGARLIGARLELTEHLTADVASLDVVAQRDPSKAAWLSVGRFGGGVVVHRGRRQRDPTHAAPPVAALDAATLAVSTTRRRPRAVHAVVVTL